MNRTEKESINFAAMNRFYYILLFAVFLSSCGQQVAPTGGAKDSLPPKLVMAIPEVNAKNFKSDKIILYFDEYVTLENPFEKLTYSPVPKTNPTSEGKLRTITIKIKDTLEANTTYSIDFGDAIKDINESNILKNFNFLQEITFIIFTINSFLFYISKIYQIRISIYIKFIFYNFILNIIKFILRYSVIENYLRKEI